MNSHYKKKERKNRINNRVWIVLALMSILGIILGSKIIDIEQRRKPQIEIRNEMRDTANCAALQGTLYIESSTCKVVEHNQKSITVQKGEYTLHVEYNEGKTPISWIFIRNIGKKRKIRIMVESIVFSNFFGICFFSYIFRKKNKRKRK